MSETTLPEDAETNDEYPTRCSSCNRPVHKFALFPKEHCLDCHAAVTPMPTAEDVIRMWGGRA